MATIPTLQELLKSGVHFGHRTSRWHPKMAPFIFGVRSGVHIIDLEKTQEQLEKALARVEQITSTGGSVVFIGTKKQIAPIIERSAKEAGMPYVTNRWLGGTFTNFPEIQKLIRNFLDLRDKREKGELKKYTKLEQLQFDRKIEDLEEKIGGISSLTKLPDAVFVFDVRSEKTAIEEAQKRGITIMAVCDTNVNPAPIDYVIPANDDSILSISLMSRLVADAAKAGKAKAGSAPVKVAPVAKKEEKEEDVVVAKASVETVEDLDDEVKDGLAREKEEAKTKK